MKSRTADLGETTAVALMGTDIERIAQHFQMIHEVYASLIEIAVAIWLLEEQVYLACLAPIFIIIGKDLLIALYIRADDRLQLLPSPLRLLQLASR